MRVLYVQDQEIYTDGIDYYHPKSKNCFSRYLAGLKDDEILSVLCYRVENDREAYDNYQIVSNQRIRYIPIPNYRSARNLFKIANCVKRQVCQSDFCYIRTGISGIAAAHYCSAFHIPYMFIINEDMEANLKTNRRAMARAIAPIVGYLLRHYIKRGHSALYVTEEYLQAKYPCAGKSIGCSDVEGLVVSEENLEEYQSKRHDSKQLIVGTAGSVDTPLKGQGSMIKAISLLRDEGYEVKYHLVGPGEGMMLKKLTKELGLQERVLFLGQKSHQDVLAWMKTIDVYIQPSKSEGLPRTIVEALSCALPCLGTNVGGIPELIPAECLFEDGDEAYKAIVRIFKELDESTLKALSKKSFEKSKHFETSKLEMKRGAFLEMIINDVRNITERSGYVSMV